MDGRNNYENNDINNRRTPNGNRYNAEYRRNQRQKKQKGKGYIVFMLIFLVAAAILAVTTITYASKYKSSEQQLQKQSQTVEEYKSKATEMEQKYNEEKKNAEEWKKKYDNLAAIKKGDKKIAYLTFDDGPSDNTLKILDILKSNNAKATFFVVGTGKTQYMKNIVSNGNQIALHSFSHKYDEIYSSVDNYFDDLNRIKKLVKKETGHDCKALRFPGGSSNTVSSDYCKGIMSTLTDKVHSKGLEYYDWDCDSTDASGNNVEPSKLVAGVQSGAYGRFVTVLMHDTKEKSTTVDALPQIITLLRDKGYDFDVLDNCPKPCHHSVNN